MNELEGFAPIVSKNSKVLILGTMPGTASLAKQEYYGHPRNAFWPIMSTLFSMDAGANYLERRHQLLGIGIAVWDVLEGCHRQGSLDASIDMKSIRVNRFIDFFARYRNIKFVFFNGAMAEKLYIKHSSEFLNHQFSYLRYHCLPSTSPANATLNLAQKIEAWKIVKLTMLK